MDEEAALLAAIEATPTEDLPRLVYAVWLDEHGRPEGEFIRLECELAQLQREWDQEQRLRNKLRYESYDIELVPADEFETYLHPRAILVASLLRASRGLDPEWIARVCRLPEHELYARYREIQSLLRKRMTVAEVLVEMAEWDQPSSPKGFSARIRGLFKRPAVEETHPDGPHVCRMKEWLESNLRPGDELWEYSTDGESWAHLCGEMGYAIVRNGKVVEFEMLLMN